MKELQIFVLFLAVRLASVWMNQTWFVADEYWQSLEVAHKMSFGYGHLTWEWVIGIRSYLYPGLIAILYKILELIRLDYVEVLIILPRIFQAILSAYADLRFYNWTGNHKWAAFNIAISWFWFYTSSRTLTNTLETSLTTIALSYFPWNDINEKMKHNFLWFVALLCVIRPTAAVPWLPLCAYHLYISKDNLKSVILKDYLLIGTITMLLSIALDSYCHGEFIVTSWQFLKLNVFHNIGSFYGSNPWHWYMSTGLPAILGIFMLPFILGAVKTIRHKEVFSTNFMLLVTIMFTVTVYSFLAHKEFRFILPLLPMSLYVASDFITRWSYKANNILLWIVATVLLLSNVIPAWYLGMIHQRGTIDVMKPLSQIAKEHPKNTSILFLMPCHTTPLYSHLHVNVTTRILSCEPNFGNSQNYKDEAEQFFENPNAWLYAYYPPNGTIPSHIVSFDNLVPSISNVLSRYKPIYRFFHTNIPQDNRFGNYVVIHEKIH